MNLFVPNEVRHIDSGDASSKSVAVPLRSVNIFCLSFGITSGVNTSSVESTGVSCGLYGSNLQAIHLLDHLVSLPVHYVLG